MTRRMTVSRTRLGRLVAGALLVLGLAALAPVAAGASEGRRPDRIDLPTGWRPEGVASFGKWLYAGSIPTGDIYRADRNTGAGSVFVDAPAGRAAIGLEVDEARGWLWAAGGGTGQVAVYDLKTGAEVAVLAMPVPGATTFINDVQVNRNAAWVTDSANAVVYRVPLARNAIAGPAVAVPLTGAWAQVPGTNANGIVSTPDGKALLIVNTASGLLYRVGTDGVAEVVTLVGTPNGLGTLPNGDGMFRVGNHLWVVQNRLNQIVELEVDRDGRRAETERVLTDPALDVPATVTVSGGGVYAVNARFGVPSPGTAAYAIIRLPRSGD